MATDQAVNGFQSHTGSERLGTSAAGSTVPVTPTRRQASGENAYAYSSSVDEAMEAFLIDWGVPDAGHRNNILQPNASHARPVLTRGRHRHRHHSDPELEGRAAGHHPGLRHPGQRQRRRARRRLQRQERATASFGMNEGEGANVEVDATNLSTGVTSSTQTWGTAAVTRSRSTPASTRSRSRSTARSASSRNRSDSARTERRGRLQPHRAEPYPPDGRAGRGPGRRAPCRPSRRSSSSSSGNWSSWSSWTV